MTGSAFITYNQTWACSNDVSMGVYSEPQFGENGVIASVKETNTLTFKGLFTKLEQPQPGEKCEVVFKNEDTGIKYGFIGSVRSVGKIHTIINILAKTERISEILSNITFKN